MKILKNIIEDAMEYNENISKYNSINKMIEFEPIREEKVITIALEEYKELLVYKGKYLGLVGINETSKTDTQKLPCKPTK